METGRVERFIHEGFVCWRRDMICVTLTTVAGNALYGAFEEIVGRHTECLLCPIYDLNTTEFCLLALYGFGSSLCFSVVGLKVHQVAYRIYHGI